MSDLIEQDPAALLALKFIRTMWAQEKVVVVEGEDHPKPAQLAALDNPVHFADVRIEGMRVADDKMQAGTICRRNNFVAFLECESQRLLDQNMLAFLHRFDRLARVKLMRRRDVDGLNGRIPAQFMKVRIDRRVELPRKRIARTRQRIHPGTERDFRMCYRGANHERSSEPKSCDPEPNRRLWGVGARFDIHENPCEKPATASVKATR